MTVVWAWADLGNHDLQTYNIKQYWLIMSVLSVRKFNPEWKRVFFVDQETYNFLDDKKWTHLWDEVNVIDFSNTEYGNLYDIKIYSWPKIYSYGLVDDDILILDTDIVFVKKFEIPDRSKICGYTYNHFDDISSTPKPYNLQYKWPNININQHVLHINGVISDLMHQKSNCFLGAPIYCPKQYTKDIQKYLLNHIHNVEKFFGGICPNDTYQSIEEEFPLYTFAKNTTGVEIIDEKQYKHGYTYSANFNIETGYNKPENLLEIPIFKTYFQ
jgi:hypothetical protein